MKLMQLDYIGGAGRAAAEKGMERCEKVLASLGIDVEAMKQEINQRADIEVINV